ncbi:MAG: hypoxanthine-guanine phosphoribosyltransferase [Xanthomonadaceae bacterium]|jgi:hypoxanthine phosphoribosyltransferase|nr:hypoxanthine-guanine phosphoribosyltransferase [Xanthomonadaceae bacterium]
MSNLPFSEVMKTADLLVERPVIDQAIARMAGEIAKDHAVDEDGGGQADSPVFLTVMHGALPFAGQLSLELGACGLDLQFDYLHATRYRGQIRGSDLIWKHRPATPLAGRRVLLIDDILDEGHTLREVRQWCLEQGAVDARIAALVVKQHDRCCPGLKADYVGVTVPDRYVFGFGMDYHEQGRNLPHIYALGE